jgi:predicted permease
MSTRRRSSEDFQAEIQSHILIETDRLIASGMSPEQARQTARRIFGRPTSAAEQFYESTRPLLWLEQLAADLRYALRTLRKSPGFAAIAVLTLALGIGVNATIFSMLSTALFRPLPVANGERLVVAGHAGDPMLSFPDYLDFREQSRSFDGIAATLLAESSLDVSGQAHFVGAEVVSGNYAQVVGLGTELGKWFTTDDEPSAVISYSAWERIFGRDPAAVGKTIRSEGLRYTVVGVAPRQYSGLWGLIVPDVWVPMRTWSRQYPGIYRDLANRNRPHIMAVGALKPGADRNRAAAELNLISHQGHANDLQSRGPLPPIVLTPANGFVDPRTRKQVAPVMAFLVVVVGLILCIACANVGSLIMARGVAREREISVRLTVGASRGRLARQLLTESAVLAALGGLAGILLGAVSNRLMVALFRLSFPLEGLQLSLTLDRRAVVLTAVVSMLSVLVFGLIPTRQAVRTELVPALKGESSSASRVRLRRAALVGQVALSVILLFCAGSFLRTIGRLSETSPGYPTESRLYAQVYASPADFSVAQGRAFYARALEQVRALPGVRNAAISNFLPPIAIGRGCVSTPGKPVIRVSDQIVDEGYLPTMRIPVISGRNFAAGDNAEAPARVILSEELASRLWPGESAVGRQMLVGCERFTTAEVIGVAHNATVRKLGEQPEPHYYRPFAQEFAARAMVVVETAGDPAPMIPVLERTILAQSQSASVYSVETLQDYVQKSLWQVRFETRMLGAFGLLGLSLAAVGLYGTVAYRVSLRTREIAIRMALGARRGGVFGLVISEALRLTALGIAIGLALSFPMGRVLAGLVAGIRPGDAVTYAGTAAIWIAVALAGSYLPARRAAGLNPVSALRQE